MIDPTGNSLLANAATARPLPLDRLSTEGNPAEVAQRFEAVFVQQFVGALRTSAEGFGEGMFGSSSGNDTYTAWFDQFMAEHITRNGGVGLAKVVERGLARRAALTSQAGPGRLEVTA